jgi:hypothetical protein
MLYLALDNILQDCSELPSGELSDTEIVQDYKKLSKKTTSIPKVYIYITYINIDILKLNYLCFTVIFFYIL